MHILSIHIKDVTHHSPINCFTVWRHVFIDDTGCRRSCDDWSTVNQHFHNIWCVHSSTDTTQNRQHIVDVVNARWLRRLELVMIFILETNCEASLSRATHNQCVARCPRSTNLEVDATLLTYTHKMLLAKLAVQPVVNIHSSWRVQPHCSTVKFHYVRVGYMHLAGTWTYCGKIKTTLSKHCTDAYFLVQETILLIIFNTAYTR